LIQPAQANQDKPVEPAKEQAYEQDKSVKPNQKKLSTLCPFKGFILMIVGHLRTLNLNETADRLLSNMDEAIDYLKRNNWT
jgi:hypothetical protein